jgi:alpha-amylase
LVNNRRSLEPTVRRLTQTALPIALLSGLAIAQPQMPTDNGLVYEVFVRSFADGDGDPKKIGDLRGLAARLPDYLNDGDPATDTDLEVGVIWLMPIFPASSYHGYDVTDFRDISPDYGTMEDFKALIAKAHTRGVRVIVDAPFNHTSADHPWFREALAHPASPRRRFYFIEPDGGPRSGAWHAVTTPGGERVRYLGVFSPRMPDLNFDNPEVRREVKEIASFWLDLGVDGFRLDAAKHVYGDRLDPLAEADVLRNNEWWREFSHFVYRKVPGAILVGEVLGDSEMLRRHAWGLDALLDEPFMNDVRAQVAGPATGFAGRHRQFVEQAREVNRMAHDSSLPFPDRPFESFAFVASHDRNPRLASDIEEMRRRGMPYSVEEGYRLSMYMLLTMASRPLLYEGDEVMQRGWKWNGNPRDDAGNPGDGSGIFDETLREPFPWFASGFGPGQTGWFPPRFDFANDGVSVDEQGRTGGMLDLVRGLTNLRTRHPGLAGGDIGAVLSDSDDWMVFERIGANARYLVLINLTSTGHDYLFHEAWYPQYRGADLLFWSDGRLRKWQDTTAAAQRIADSVFVPPIGLAVLRRARH